VSIYREPMSERQEAFLRAHLVDEFDPTLTKSQAIVLIGALKRQTAVGPEQVRAVACPACGVEAGQPCIRESHHQARVDAAQG
jgi:hypothetical protein